MGEMRGEERGLGGAGEIGERSWESGDGEETGWGGDRERGEETGWGRGRGNR